MFNNDKHSSLFNFNTVHHSKPIVLVLLILEMLLLPKWSIFRCSLGFYVGKCDVDYLSFTSLSKYESQISEIQKSQKYCQKTLNTAKAKA